MSRTREELHSGTHWTRLVPLAACLATALLGLAAALRDPGHAPVAPLLAEAGSSAPSTRPTFASRHDVPLDLVQAPAARAMPASPGAEGAEWGTAPYSEAGGDGSLDAAPTAGPVQRADRPGRHADIATRLGWAAGDRRASELQRWLGTPGERRGADLLALFGRSDAEAIAREAPPTRRDPLTGLLVAVDLDGRPIPATGGDAQPER